MDNLNIEALQNKLTLILSKSQLWQDKILNVFMIVNDTSGGFLHPQKSSLNYKRLNRVANFVKDKKDICKVKNFALYKTSYSGQGKEITLEVINDIKAKPQDEEFLIVIAGGDGTCLEVQSVLVEKALENDEYKELVKNKIAVLRLPFGTGNDATDGRTLDACLNLLVRPSYFALQSAVKISFENYVSPEKFTKHTKGMDIYKSLSFNPPWYSFNIASVGVDAYIAHMTNKTKNLMYGNFYKLWVNLAALFYGISFPQKEMNVEVYDEIGNLIKTIDSRLEFSLLGVSGHRTYGSNHLILPNDDTFCATKKMNVIKRIKYLKDFETGEHIDCPCVIFAKAHSLKVNYNEYILLQLDGEIKLIHPNNFPLTMERTEPLIRYIKAKPPK